VVPCVDGGDEALSLEDLGRLGPRVVDEPVFAKLATLPVACSACPQRETCSGGCPSRRSLRGTLDAADDYCPFVRGVEVPLTAQQHELGRSLPNASSVCTTIFRSRGRTR